MKRFRVMILIMLVSVVLFACSGKSGPAPTNPQESDGNERVAQVDLTISAAASMTDALEILIEKYAESNPHVKLTFNMGPSGQLQQQIEQGAPVDVFISAAQRQMNALEEKGLIINDTRVDILRNELVLIVQKGKTNIQSFEDLKKAQVKHIGIGSPESVPAGQYAKEVLTNLNLWGELRGKMVEGQNVRTVLSYVETGNAEAGFVYSSDTVMSDKVEIVATAPTGAASPILYPAAVIKSSKNVDEARAFVEFLQTDIAIQVLEQFGFRRL